MADFQSEELETATTSIDYSTGGELAFQPSLSELLNEPVSEVSPWEFSHRLAADNWQNYYQPKPLASNLEKVRGHLEAFYHYCEVADWAGATKILKMPLFAWTNQPLHRQLGRWGYYQEQVELYTHLLQGDLEPEVQCICLDGLGWATCYMGNFKAAIDHYQNLLTLAQQFHLPEFEARAFGGLGNTNLYLDLFKESEKLIQQQLELAQRIGNLEQEGWAFCYLGNCYSAQNQYARGLRSSQAALTIAKQINDQELQHRAFLDIGSTYLLMGAPRKAIQHLNPESQELQDSLSSYHQWLRLRHLANCRMMLGQYDKGEQLFHQILRERQKLSPYQLNHTLASLGALYARKGDHQKALDYSQQAYNESVELGQPEGQFSDLCNLSYSYLELREFVKAKQCIDQAQNLLVEIDNRQCYGLHWAARAALNWKLQRYGRSILQLTRAFYHAPPWKSDDGKIIVNIAIREITTTILNWLKSSIKRSRQSLSSMLSLLIRRLP